MPSNLCRLLRAAGRFLWQPLADPADPVRSRDLAELLSLTVAVCSVLFLTKGFVASRDLSSMAMPPLVLSESWGDSYIRLWSCSAEDFAVGLACLFAAGLALRLVHRSALRRTLRGGAHVAAALAIVYMLVNAQVFHVLRCFLTCSLVQFAGGLKPERSILEYATPEIKAIIAFVPLLALALHLFLVSKLAHFWKSFAGVVCQPLLLLAGIAGLAHVCDYTRHNLFANYRDDFTRNAHLLLARSFLFAPEFSDVGPKSPEFDEFRPNQPRLAGLPLTRRPVNVIVIVIESLSSLYLDLFGGPFPVTPRLQALAPRTVRFDNFYATSNRTIASVLPLAGSQWNDPLSIATALSYPNRTQPSAAVWMKQHGYHTGFLGAGGWWVWDNYYNLSTIVGRDWDLGRDLNHPFWKQGGEPDRILDNDYLDDAMFADAHRFVRAERGRPFFLLLWNYATHAPYRAEAGDEWDVTRFPPAIVGSNKDAEFRRYLSGLHRTDTLIGNLMDELDRLELADDTLVVVTGDHGEGFGQHGTFMHGYTLYEEEMRVPLLLIHRPLAKVVGTRRDVIGSHIDLWSTIVDVCGVPADPVWQGRSLFGDADDRRALFSDRKQAGVREGRWKYIWEFERQRDLLFDLDADPGEHVNVAAEHSDYCRRQRRRLRDWAQYESRHRYENVAGGG